MLSVEFKKIAAVWPMVSDVFAAPHTEQEYDRAIAFLDELIDEVGEDENHPLASLMDTIGTLIETYESEHFPEPVGDPIASLAFLMEEHGLNGSDLPEIGSPEKVLEILNRKRELDLNQIRALSKRFNVSPEVFMMEKEIEAGRLE
ncbi:MAG: helix-turn-helix domain-containing protein [bacterium]